MDGQPINLSLDLEIRIVLDLHHSDRQFVICICLFLPCSLLIGKMANTPDIRSGFLQRHQVERAQMGTFTNAFAILTNGVETYAKEKVGRLGLNPEIYELWEMNHILVGNRINKKRWPPSISIEMFDLLEELRRSRHPSTHGTEYFYRMMLTFDHLLFTSPHIRITITKSAVPAIQKNGNGAGLAHHSGHVIDFTNPTNNPNERSNLLQGTLENHDLALKVWTKNMFDANHAAIPGDHEYVVQFVFGKNGDSETFLIRRSFHTDLRNFFGLSESQNPMILYLLFEEEYLLRDFIPSWPLPPHDLQNKK